MKEGGNELFSLSLRGPAPGCSSTCALLRYKFTIGVFGEKKVNKTGTSNALRYAYFSPRSRQGSVKALRADCMGCIARRTSGTSMPVGKRACDARKAGILCRSFF
jgi:hypothetical protein